MRAASSISARGKRTDPREWRRGLILSHTHIGDILYRTCSLPELRASLPDCEWTYATSNASAPVLKGNPHIAEVLPVITGENSWDLSIDGAEQLRAGNFDAVLCTNTLRHHPDLVLATRLGIPNRVAFSGKGMSGLIDHRVQLQFPQPYAAYFRSMVAFVTNHEAAWELRPRLYFSQVDTSAAAAMWNEFALGSRPVVACALATRQQHGNWPRDVLIAVLQAALGALEFDVVLCGGPENSAELNSLARELPFRAQVLAGQLDLLPYAAFLGRCTALLTLDSGPRHIGNAVGIPVLFARNLSHSMIEAGKYAENEIDLAPPVEYLSDVETERVARAQPVDLLAAKLLEAVKGRSLRA